MKTNDFSDQRKDYCRQFLKEYDLDVSLGELEDVLDQQLQEQTPAEIKQQRAKIINQIKEFDYDLEECQIRVLSQPDRLTYVAVLKKWEDDLYLVAPYSHFSTPATDTELLTGREFIGLRVLELWNACTLPYHLLIRGWTVCMMSEQEYQEAWEILELSLTGKTPSQNVQNKTGIPIFSSTDPRLEYKKKELQYFSGVNTAAHQYETILERAAGIFSVIAEPLPYPAFETGLRAAGGKEICCSIYIAEILDEALAQLPALPARKVAAELSQSFIPFNPQKTFRELYFNLPPDTVLNVGDLLIAWHRESKVMVGHGVIVGMHEKTAVLKYMAANAPDIMIESIHELLLIAGKI